MRPEDAACEACQGSAPCKGGGNKRCIKRNWRISLLGIILDSYGGILTLVAEKRYLRGRHDDFVFIVPGLTLHEPIAWNDIPIVIARAKYEFEKWLDTNPNLTPEHQRAVTLYRLRCLEQDQESLNLYAIAET